MPAFAEVLGGEMDRAKHTFVGYKLWTSAAVFGEGPQSPKEMNPAWKYQTTAVVALLGCAIFANLICIIQASDWNTGYTTMDKVHNVSMHLQGLILSLLCLTIEIEWVQMLAAVAVFRNLIARSILYCLLAASTYEASKAFYYFEYIQYVAAGLLTNAGIYMFFGVYFTARDCIMKPRYDDTL